MHLCKMSYARTHIQLAEALVQFWFSFGCLHIQSSESK